MTDMRYDAIVVGAGHNGLVCAAMLARAGWRVLVLEAAEHVGGAAASHEFHEGFTVSSAAHLLYQLQPQVVRELDLRIPMASEAMKTVVLDPGGAHLRLGLDADGAPEADREAYREFMALGYRLARFLNRQFTQAPPRLESDPKGLLGLALGLRRLGRDDMRELLRLIGQNMHDEATGRFGHPLLQGALCFDATLGSHAGPRSPGTLLSWLYRLAGDDGQYAVPRGGMAVVAEAIAARAAKAGAEIRTGSRVQRIVIDNGVATGVELGGQFIGAGVVISNADPKTTVQGLVGERHFESPFARRIRHLRSSGNVAKLHLALDRLPADCGLDETDWASRLLLAPDADTVEASFSPVKYGELATERVFEISVPSVADPACAPAGGHVMSLQVPFVPYALKGGWTNDARASLVDSCLDTLGKYLPGLPHAVIATELLLPVDIETRFGMHGGHWHHGELALDQFMFTRPVVGASRYRLPIDGLYLCGAGTHPGGGISGACGYNAARAVLDGGRR